MSGFSNVCIVGGGSLGHVLIALIGSRTTSKVSLLTGHPEQWGEVISAYDDNNWGGTSKLKTISQNPADVIPPADLIIFCLPGFMNAKYLAAIKPFLKNGATVGGVFSSNGFFFEAMDILDKNTPIWGFQRVPFIARVNEYGKSANILGRKSSHKIAIEHGDAEIISKLSSWIESVTGSPVSLLQNYLEASISNSNPILHTARLYSMFKDCSPAEIKTYPTRPYFYEEWTEEAAELYIKMDKELHAVCDKLPVSKDFLPTVLDYYESTDASSLASKLRSIPAFKGILSPMVKCDDGWEPDLGSRYFTEDFMYGLKYIYKLAKEYNVNTPTINEVYQWGDNILLNYDRA